LMSYGNMWAKYLVHIHGGRGAVKHLTTTQVGELITTSQVLSLPRHQRQHLLIAPRLMTLAGLTMHL
jgi:hypothetical protein